MKSSLDALLRSLVDYAGLFPPASLSLQETLGKYAEYRSHGDAPMLGRLILPVSKFDEAAKEWREMGRKDRIPVSALLPRTADMGQFRDVAGDLFPKIRQALADETHPLRPEVLEVPLPDTIGMEAQETGLGAFLQMWAVESDHYGVELPVFLEPPMEGDFVTLIDGLTAVVAEQNGSGRAARFGWKLRCGGLHAGAFPSSETLSRFLAAAARHGVPMKATAGLHHPWPVHDESIGARMHGFVNLLAATAMARRDPSARERIAEILDDDDPDSFSLEPHLRWRTETFEGASLAALRSKGLTSFGSCSFDEPRDDLRNHGIALEF